MRALIGHDSVTGFVRVFFLTKSMAVIPMLIQIQGESYGIKLGTFLTWSKTLLPVVLSSGTDISREKMRALIDQLQNGHLRPRQLLRDVFNFYVLHTK